MSNDAVSWVSRPEADPATVDARLARLGVDLEAGPPHTVCWLDTFDDRLFAAGEAAALVGERLERRGLDGAVFGSGRVARGAPWTVDSLPPELRAVWAPIIEMRALLPRVETVRTRLSGTVRRKGKLAGRLTIEVTRAARPGHAEAMPLPARITFEPGPKRKRAAKALSHLQQALPVREAAAEGPVSLARSTVGAVPGAYRSKLRAALHPEARADAAIKAIMRQVFDVLRANEAGLLADLDPEFNHDFRVAVRRTRSALTQLDSVLPAPVVERFGPEFRWLQGLTGPLRNLDVYLLAFSAYRDRLPEPLRDALDPLLTLILRAQTAAHADVVSGLTSSRYRALVDGWQAWLESPVPDPGAGPGAKRAVARVARRRIGKVYAKVIAEGLAIGADTPAEAVHALRKRCKALRYLLEFFRALFPPAGIGRVIRALKTLQTHLGAFNDLEVHRDALLIFADQLAAQGAPASTGRAVGVLVEQLTVQQQAVRDEVEAQVARFAAAENQAAFAEVLA